MSKLITVSPSPHIHSGKSVDKLMKGVIIAMLPALGASFYFYGFGAIYVTLLSVLSCIFFEYIISKTFKIPARISDGSAIVTGILLAFNLPSSLPPHIIIIGALVAIGIGKMTFGGLGNNPFNPALVGRVFLLLSFPSRLTVYPIAKGFKTDWLLTNSEIAPKKLDAVADSLSQGLDCIPATDTLDAVTGATPLSLIKEAFKNGESFSSTLSDSGISYSHLFLGNTGGSIGEIAALFLIIGLVYMLIKKIITWHIPISIISTIFIFSGILWVFSFEGHNFILEHLNISIPNITYNNDDGILCNFHMADPVFHLITGGALLSAIFMATDYVTSPMSVKGQIIYGVFIGLLTIIIRVFGAYPEGASFAILIMNAFTPLINRYFKPRRFGVSK